MMAIQNQEQRNHKQQQPQPQPQQQLQQQHNRNQTPPQEPPMSATCNATTTGTTTAPTIAATTTNSASNGGPRVSFNRDVHVKRIGKRPSESTNYETTNLQPLQAYHQLPADLSADSIRKEAALVLAQAERHKSKAENGDNIPIFKVKTKRSGGDAATTPNKFHSLPTRKKKPAAKPVSRSVSDAAAKKPSKRPSIFSIFSRKSESNVNQAGGDPRFEESGGRRLVRSKSDVGSTAKDERKSKKTLKDHKQQPPTANGSAKQLSTPLSPIFENALTEEQFEEQFNRERRKSEAITDREKHESGLNELLERSRHQAEVDGSLLGKTPISTNIKDKILSLQEGNLNENMHSSQLPAQRLPLTKGVTVNGMIKRLSRERFSPPPPITGPVFSYIRPNEGITYAQLDHSDDQQPYHNTYNRRDQMRSPVHETRTPVREYRSPIRDVRDIREIRSMERTTTRPSIDQTDFVHTSQPPTILQQHKSARSSYNHNSRIIIESPMNMSRDSFSPVAGPTTIRISSSHSPSPWQQLSPRNLSDEDEGLGFETRKYFDEDYSVQVRSKSPPEPPIVPVIRSITPPPVDIVYPHVHNYRSEVREEPVDNLGYRRAQLESRILTRRFGDNTLEREFMPQRVSQPELSRHMREEYQQQQHHVSNSHQRYLTPERDEFGSRFHKPQTTEILQKYSPERSHLDMVSPSAKTTVKSLPKTETKTSRYKHTKYYDDGAGGVKEVYERETRTDGSGQPRVRESRHRERLDSLNATQEHSSTERPQLTDYEPKSLDSQYTNTELYRSSPENMKRYEMSNGLENGYQRRKATEEHWQSSLKRDKLQQRSFDKGDSGIENDFRKESFNGDLTNRWRKRTYADDVQACEAFLKKERRHTENLTADRYAKETYVYRERSIDDGSHYDPHLDKYPTATSTLRRTARSTERQTQTATTSTGQETLKRNKKVGGFEKVKQLFTGGVVSGSGGGSGGGGSSSSSSKKENVEHSSLSGAQTLPKDKYMVKEEEMRSRYREHRGSLQNELREPKTTDISMRRRLSTPKASPLLIKRSEPKKKPSPLVQKNITEKPEKTSWFKSLDRRTKSKSKEKLDVSVNGQNETSSMKRSKPSRTATVAPPIPPKNLRFFGDTDLDSNPPTISRVTTTPKSRPSVATTLNRSQKYSQSAYHLDRINAKSPQPQAAQTSRLPSERPLERTSIATARHKSSSMHNLENEGTDEIDFRKRRHYSRSRDLDDISESGSETEEKHKRQNGFIGSAASRSLSREKLDRSHRYDDHAYRKSSERQTPTTLPNGELHTLRKQHHQQLTGPPKPARSVERRGMTSRDRERYPAESSGTEGESSLHSQRSIVYLHATTVGAIPQPYHLSGRSISRDDLRSNKSKNQPLQPMTRTVSRSVSMLAPWKPKLISEGYEINYSQEQNKRMATLPRKQQQQQQLTNGNTSTLTRNGKKSEAPLARSRRHELMKDDQSSLRNSSTTSASKSALSSNLHANTRRKIK